MSSSPHKVLIVGPAWLGDIVMAQTLFKSLKSQHPLQQIDVLTPAWSRSLFASMPEVDSVIDMPVKHGQVLLKTRYKLAQSIKQRNYSQVIVLPNSFKSALVPWLAHIPLRTGWRGEMRWGLLNDIRYLNKKAYPLMIQRFAALAWQKDAILPEDLPSPQLIVKAESVHASLSQLGLHTGQPILALCPGAAYGPAKRWPTSHFAQIAKYKLQEGWQVWLFGAEGADQQAAKEINMLTANRCLDLCGKTNLSQAVSLLSLATMVVSNDSGLMHVAAALARPLVAIYGSSSADFTPPLTSIVKISSLKLSCSPCFARECRFGHYNCLQQLSPQRILIAMEELQA